MTNFDKFTIAVGIIAVITIVFIFFNFTNRPATVSLDAKHFACTDAIPDGLGTKCINYHYIGVK